MKYISTKQLRQVFPEVRADLAKGEEYVLIHRSQPIARLLPLEDKKATEPAEKSSSKAEEVSATTFSSEPENNEHITTHILHKPLTLPVPAGYSHPVAFKHLKLDLKETVHLVKPSKVL